MRVWRVSLGAQLRPTMTTRSGNSGEPMSGGVRGLFRRPMSKAKPKGWPGRFSRVRDPGPHSTGKSARAQGRRESARKIGDPLPFHEKAAEREMGRSPALGRCPYTCVSALIDRRWYSLPPS
jgi:hypothetical protein